MGTRGSGQHGEESERYQDSGEDYYVLGKKTKIGDSTWRKKYSGFILE